MKRNALTIMGAAGVAALLLFIAAWRSPGYAQPHPYAAAAWLSSILAFCISAVMLLEYGIHGRRSHLYLGAAFLALGIMGAWDALLLPGAIQFPQTSFTYHAIWTAEWITLAIALIYALFVNQGFSGKRHVVISSAVIAAGIVWAGLAIFLISIFPAVSQFLSSREAGYTIGATCGVVFALSCAIYSRPSVHRGNAVLLWMSGGLVFAAFTQLARLYPPSDPLGPVFGFASLMKVLAYLAPLAGMLAEHTRLQMKLRDQATELNNIVQVQQALNSIPVPAELYKRIVELVSFSFGGSAVCLLPFDKERGLLHVAASAGLDEETTRRLVFRPGEGPPGDAFLNRETAITRDVSKDPVLGRKLDGVSGEASAVFLPLISKNDCLGVLGVFFAGALARQKPQKEHMRLLETLAGETALAVESTMLRGQVFDSTRTFDGQAREMEIVWEIGQAVASKLELHELVDTLAEKLGLSVGAKTCSVLVFDANLVGLRIMGHRTLTRHHTVAEHVDQCDRVSAMVAKTGEVLVANNIPNSGFCKYPEMVTEEGGAHHLLCVPMRLRGFLGAINVFRQNAEPFGEREKRLLTRLAPMVAAGIRNAELYERERKIAENLQECFLPKLPEDLPDLQVSTLYQAAFDESHVGGDFYDLFHLDEGRYGMVLGDVAGKGLDAAVYTGMTRYMIQAYSAEDPDPEKVAARLNGALHRYTPAHKFVTLVYGILDTNQNMLHYVNAGHELPFIYRAADNRVEVLQTTGTAAGAVLDAQYTCETLPFNHDDILILYTDGASDVKHNGKYLGTDGLREIVESAVAKGVDDLPTAILDGIRAYSDGELRDDVALLAIKRRRPGSLF